MDAVPTWAHEKLSRILDREEARNPDARVRVIKDAAGRLVLEVEGGRSYRLTPTERRENIPGARNILRMRRN